MPRAAANADSAQKPVGDIPTLAAARRTSSNSPALNRGVNRCERPDAVPAVVPIVSRRLNPPPAGGARSFYLGPAKRADVRELADRFAAYAPERRAELQSITPGTAQAVPFHFGLLAFHENFTGIPNYVLQSVENLNDAERQVLLTVALSHRYGGIGVAADLFANILGLSATNVVQLGRALRESVRMILVEDEEGFWCTGHWLVAAEVLYQLLTPRGGSADAWKLSLSGQASRVIVEAKAVFGESSGRHTRGSRPTIHHPRESGTDPQWRAPESLLGIARRHTIQ